MRKFLRKFRRHDNFKLDASREVVIDGREMIIVGYSADAPWGKLTKLSVDFIPTSEYTARFKR